MRDTVPHGDAKGKRVASWSEVMPPRRLIERTARDIGAAAP
jgi:hypothetical protein